MIKKLLLFTTTVLIVAFSPVKATNKTDSLSISGTDSQYRFKAKELILPGALVAVGATSLFLNPMEKLDEIVHEGMVDMRGNHHRIGLDEYLRFVPTATEYILHFSGVKSNYDIKDRLLVTATSYAAMFVLTQGLKHSINKMRPDGSDNHSFPSGHVATAFLGAENLRISYGNWWGLAGYTIATGTAFLRLYNNRHWIGDVIGAAGIGILSSRIGYWLLPWEKKILGLDKGKHDTSFIAMPTYDSYHNAPGLAMAIQF